MAGGTRLELEERERLAALKAEGLSLRAIARALGRAASTVSRELRRNALPKGGYLPVHAEGCYRERRQRPAVLERDERLGRESGSLRRAAESPRFGVDEERSSRYGLDGPTCRSRLRHGALG
jgi:IS30 family transposase